MVGSYDYRLVALSIIVAFIASLAAFMLVARVFRSEPKTARLWLLVGGATMGTGIWSMHFIGMLAFSLPIPMGYSFEYTVLSWLIAVAVSWLALKLTSQHKLSGHILVSGGIIMGIGIASMHYTGMHAMQMFPPIIYDSGLFTISLFISIGASIIALLVLFSLRVQHIEQTSLAKIGAAFVMAVAISGMHYTGMAAAEFAPNAICRAADNLHPVLLSIIVALGTTGLVMATFIAAILDNHKQHNGLASKMSLKEANQELSHLATHDPLTQLPNRLAFQHHLELGIRRTARIGNSLAIAFIDLDSFKPVNDNLGHHVGDQLLIQVAKRLNTAVRGGDVVARMGGDEFIALIEDIRADQDIIPVVERIIQSLQETFNIDEHAIHISASVGIAVYPRDGDTEKLLVAADMAMYRAKNAGKNRFCFYDAGTETSSDRLQEMQYDLRNSLANQSLELHYQPRLDSVSGDLVGVEALLRWQHPTYGYISPTTFLSIAERSGLIIPIGEWVIDEACKMIAQLRKRGHDLHVSINLSSQQCRHEHLITHIRNTLKKFSLPSSALIFEIPETVFSEETEQITTLLADLGATSIHVAMDNFGTGDSGLAHLKKLSINELKLDRSFITHIETDRRAHGVVSAIIQLAHAIGLTVVATGVESESQRTALESMGCDQLQGFLFAHPVSIGELLETISRFSEATRA